ncbi:hypothetical protein HanIR_Chr02g0056861 [Helianthus annuus]|nr:hypothetical protein HanIR_Chr02g0056861 [Helianthus annuus]
MQASEHKCSRWKVFYVFHECMICWSRFRSFIALVKSFIPSSLISSIVVLELMALMFVPILLLLLCCDGARLTLSELLSLAKCPI